MYLGITIYTQYITMHVVTIKKHDINLKDIFIYIYEVLEEGQKKKIM